MSKKLWNVPFIFQMLSQNYEEIMKVIFNFPFVLPLHKKCTILF
ncbi:hypothetical protein BCE_A0189 (plasmid) [Bacillus cereus ATCC 10987]|uniref:Uncharacterized protein n=1 Tax=Bacillus cereus (strain ATCC 10987 / NRS 248) TaxID=222523 RepID=Q74NQ5_BACC1|nr:hypothetical protein BCE_A0189 [Bacillus cereus ATCC 10987]